MQKVWEGRRWFTAPDDNGEPCEQGQAYLERVGCAGVQKSKGSSLELPPDAHCRTTDASIANVERTAVHGEPAGRRVTQEVRVVAWKVLIDERERVRKHDDIGIEEHGAEAHGGQAAHVNLPDEPLGTHPIRRR